LAAPLTRLLADFIVSLLCAAVNDDQQLYCLDYGPNNMNDVTTNFMEEVEARPVLMKEGGEVTVPAEDTLPFLHIKTPLHSLTEKCLIEVTPSYHLVFHSQSSFSGMPCFPTLRHSVRSAACFCPRAANDVVMMPLDCLFQAFEFCDARKYHVVHNNCIQNADFLVRVLTGGLVKNAPLIYDVMCGNVPTVDPPMLMMLPLLMQKTW
jgi:hypothetical protein